jgi:hypothetical protein
LETLSYFVRLPYYKNNSRCCLFQRNFVKCVKKSEALNGNQKEIQPRVHACGGEDGKETRVALSPTARDLGLNENMLRRWIRLSNEVPQDALP